MEFKRVVFNPKNLFLFMFVVLISVGLYINSQFKNEEYSDYNVTEINTLREQLVDELKSYPPEKRTEIVTSKLTYTTTLCDLIDYDNLKSKDYKAYEQTWMESEEQLRDENKEIAKYYDENKKTLDINNLYVQQKVLTQLSNQIEYINGYPAYLESIDASASNMNNISIFKTEDDTVSDNIKKTVQDYSNLKNVELSIGIDEPITTVVNSELPGYLLIIFSLFVIFTFLEERKQGLWTLIYSTPNGRLRLALKRAGVLSIVIAVATVIMYICMFVTAFVFYGGTVDLSRNVQSIDMFKNFIFPMSELQFILFYIGIIVLMQLTLAFMLWFIFSFIQNITFAFGITGVIFAGEFLLYYYLPYQNYFSLFKCINLFNFVNPADGIIKYRNLETFGFTLNMFNLLIIGAIVCSAAFVISAVITLALKRPNKTSTKIEIQILKLVAKVKYIFWIIVEKFTLIGYEFYKILFIQKGLIVAIVFVFVLFNSINTDKIYYSATDSIVNNFYKEYGGKDINNAEKYLQNLAKEIEDVDKEFEKSIIDFKNNKITSEEYLNKKMKSLAFESKREALEILNERLSYAKENNLWMVNPLGYNILLGEEGDSQQTVNAILSIFVLIILLSGIFAYENKSNVYYIMKATYGGRNYIFRKKITVASVIAVFLWFVMSASDFYNVLANYNLQSFTAPVKSLMFLTNLPFETSIITYVILVYLIRLAMILCVAYIICFVSIFTKYEVCIALLSVVLVVPSLLYVLGIEMFKYLSLSILVSASNLLRECAGFTFVIPIVLVTILGVAGLIFSNKRWCKNGT
ncbi:MAG: hypothetical protein IJV39_00735 [Ruminococcus sp.]|nr:hypothetical protein [Ruminococcus sp.]